MKLRLACLLAFTFFPWTKVDCAPVFFERENTSALKRARVARYIYLGNAPRFASEDIEIYVGKVALTLRAKAWVRKDLADNYSWFLMRRWKQIHDGFLDQKLSFTPLRSVKDELGKAAEGELREWLKVVDQYYSHALEDRGFDIYDANLSSDEYKNTIITSLLRYLMNDDTLTKEQGLELYARLANEETRAPEKEKSRALWAHHLGHLFTNDASRGENYEGFLTFVYPYAGSLLGPFAQPKEGHYSLSLPGSSDARWWSGTWKDDFGNLPFILYRTQGGAIHGPTVSKNEVDAWFIDRDWISHGCLRMNVGDLLELRALMPLNLVKLAQSGQGVKQFVMDWPDVMNFQGKQVVVDAEYYRVPEKIPQDKLTDAYLTDKYSIENQRREFRVQQYCKFDKKLPSGNYYDPDTETFCRIPRYEVSGRTLKRAGFWPNPIPVLTFKNRGSQVIQYKETGVAPAGGNEDSAGQYPPKYFFTP